MEWFFLISGIALMVGMVVLSLRRRTHQRKHDGLDALKRTFERRADPFKRKDDES